MNRLKNTESQIYYMYKNNRHLSADRNINNVPDGLTYVFVACLMMETAYYTGYRAEIKYSYQSQSGSWLFRETNYYTYKKGRFNHIAPNAL